MTSRPLPFTIVGKAHARLDVVLVFRGALAEVLEAGDAGERARLARLVEDHEVRIQRLIDRHPGDQVVAEPEVQRQLVASRASRPGCTWRTASSAYWLPPSRRSRLTDERGPFDVVVQMGVRVAARAGVEREEQVRLVDEVHARLEIVTEAAHAGHVPGEVIAELPLVLLRRLRRVEILADRDVVREGLRRIQAVRA